MSQIKIEVFEDSMSEKVIATFNSIDDLMVAAKKNKWVADQVAINDCILYGWNEIYDFV